MLSELERRLEGFLHELPQAEREVEERALAASLAALRPSAPPRRGLRTAVFVFAAAFVLLAIAAGSLAAAGALHVSLGAKPTLVAAPPTTLQLPAAAKGMAVIADGKLSVVTKTGLRLQGLAVSAAALSPHALYVAASIGNSIVVMAPDGRRAWSYPTGGEVTAIAWAPDGLRIAYIVRTRRHLVLHVIWGNGRNDAVIDRSVGAMRPSWRADSLGLAYVGAGGKAVVYDLAHQAHRVIHPRGARGAVQEVAFAPSGNVLVVATRSDVVWIRPGLNQAADGGAVVGIGWANASPHRCGLGCGWLAVAHGGARPFISLDGIPEPRIPLAGSIDAFDAEGHGIAVAVKTATGTRILAVAVGAGLKPVLRLPRDVRVSYVQIG
jgi:hypothetical protein